MPTFAQIALRIIKEQEEVIGPLAWSEARKVPGLKVVDSRKGEVSIESPDPKPVIDGLVNQYEKLFGLASHDVCHSAVASMLADLPPEQVPSSLR